MATLWNPETGEYIRSLPDVPKPAPMIIKTTAAHALQLHRNNLACLTSADADFCMHLRQQSPNQVTLSDYWRKTSSIIPKTHEHCTVMQEQHTDQFYRVCISASLYDRVLLLHH
jgi:hypothetical protein